MAAGSLVHRGVATCRCSPVLCLRLMRTTLFLALVACVATRCWYCRGFLASTGLTPGYGPAQLGQGLVAFSTQGNPMRVRGHSCSRHAVAPPPTRTAPPEVGSDVGFGVGKWSECLVEYADGQAAEVWVFRQKDRGEFERLMHLRINRGYPPGDRPVDFAANGVTMGCRDRSVDPTIVCAECVRVLTGGAYGNGGISVPAYPPKPDVLDCLDLSGITAVEQGRREDGSPLITKLTETAFCNSVNVGASAVAESVPAS